MAFDAKAFERAAVSTRTKEVRVDALSVFFDDGDPVFTVRGLTYSELAAADAAVERAKAIDTMAKAISVDQSRIEAVKDALGIHGGHPEQMVRRVHFLTVGLVKPEMSEGMIVQLSERNPVEFLELSNAVIELTGLGKIVEKK